MNATKHFLNSIGRAALLVCLLAPAALPAADDLSLGQAVQLALQRNERALAAGEQQAAAQARLAQARGFFFPTVTLTGDYIRRPNEVERSIGGQSITVQKVDALAGYLTLDLSLFDPAALPAFRQALLEARAQRFRSEETRRQLSFEVAAAFLSTLNGFQGARPLAGAGQRPAFILGWLRQLAFT